MLTESRPTLGVLVGSTRVGSFTRRLIDLAAARSSHSVVVIEGLDALPYFNEGLEADPPSSVVSLRKAVAGVDGLLVATPEYNDGMPGLLKNGLDWLSRPRQSSVLGGKPSAVIGVSPTPGGAIGAARDAVRVLRRAGAAVVDEPLTVPHAGQALESGLPDDTLAALDALIDDLAASIDASVAA